MRLDHENPWHMEQIVALMPHDRRRLGRPLLLVPVGTWLLLFGLATGSIQALVGGLLLLFAGVFLVPSRLWRQPVSSVAKILVLNFAVVTTALVPLSLPLLFGFNKWGVVVASPTIVAFDAVGIALAVVSWGIWALAYLGCPG